MFPNFSFKNPQNDHVEFARRHMMTIQAAIAKTRLASILSLALIHLSLSACGVPSPIVDMAGKDPVQYQRDLAACHAYADRVFSWGNPVAKCMEQKGYYILRTN